MHHFLNVSQKLKEQQCQYTIMSLHNLIEYALNYSETTWSLWFYSKDEATNFDADNN